MDLLLSKYASTKDDDEEIKPTPSKPQKPQIKTRQSGVVKFVVPVTSSALKDEPADPTPTPKKDTTPTVGQKRSIAEFLPPPKEQANKKRPTTQETKPLSLPTPKALNPITPTSDDDDTPDHTEITSNPDPKKIQVQAAPQYVPCAADLYNYTYQQSLQATYQSQNPQENQYFDPSLYSELPEVSFDFHLRANYCCSLICWS
jgi:hypothetical protein